MNKKQEEISSSNNKRIAKNTIVLYIRMLFTMVITLFSSRIVLQALGVDDFGLYNVVGGVVALISFLRSSLTSSTQRFLSYELGRKNTDRLKKLFSMSVNTHILICLIILILSETLGLWFLNTKVQIPDDRLIAANWIYQFAVLDLCISTITVPYAADVISHEKMTFYAVTSVFEAILKLMIAYAIFFSSIDRLILYGGLMLFIAFIHFIMYWTYCRYKFYESHYSFFWDREMFSQIFSFSGWTILGQLSVIAANQGTSVLINIFHTLAANAAMGIGQQVNGALTGLTANFQTAFQPQITKSYAERDYLYLNSLIARSAKISFLLMIIVSMPIIYNIDYILEVWLGSVPQYANMFCILFLIASIFNAISAPLWISISATGKIKEYQIAISLVFFSDVIIVYLLFLFFKVPPTVAMIVKVIVNMIVALVRLYYTKKLVVGFNAFFFFKNVYLRALFVSCVIVFFNTIIFRYASDALNMILCTLIEIILSCIISFKLGFSTEEKIFTRELITKLIRKKYDRTN